MTLDYMLQFRFEKVGSSATVTDDRPICSSLIHSYLVCDSQTVDTTATRHALSVGKDVSIGTDTHRRIRPATAAGRRRVVAGRLTGARVIARYHSSGTL